MLTQIASTQVVPSAPYSQIHTPSTSGITGPEAMSRAAITLLANSIDVEPQRGAGRMDRGGWPALAPPGMTAVAVGAMFADAGARLQTALLVCIGAQDVLAHEDGAGSRLSEASAGARAWLVSSSVVLLMVAAREVLLQVEEVERASNARQVTLSYDTAIRAADMEVDIATTRFGGSIGAAVVGGAIGLAGLRKSVQANRTSGKNSDCGKLPSHHVDAAGKKVSGAMKVNQTVPGRVRPDRSIGDTPTPNAASARVDKRAVDIDRPETLLGSDRGAGQPAMARVATRHEQRVEVAERNVTVSQVDTDTQLTWAKSTFISTLAAPVAAIADSAAGIHAGQQEGAKKTLSKTAEVMSSIADEHRDQAAKTRQDREDFAQSLRQFIELENATSSHIIKGI